MNLFGNVDKLQQNAQRIFNFGSNQLIISYIQSGILLESSMIWGLTTIMTPWKTTSWFCHIPPIPHAGQLIIHDVLHVMGREIIVPITGGDTASLVSKKICWFQNSIHTDCQTPMQHLPCIFVDLNIYIYIFRQGIYSFIIIITAILTNPFDKFR